MRFSSPRWSHRRLVKREVLMDEPQRFLAFPLCNLPPTAFPALERALIEESNERSLPFEDYLKICSFVEQLSNERRSALARLPSFPDLNDDLVAQSIADIALTEGSGTGS